MSLGTSLGRCVLLEVRLPWPPRELHPNARGSWKGRHGKVHAYRSTAKALTQHWCNITDATPYARLHLDLTMCQPDARRRDVDGMLSAVKAGLDGIFDAIGVDDSRVASVTVRRGEPNKRDPGVVVRVEALSDADSQDFPRGRFEFPADDRGKFHPSLLDPE